MPLSSELAVNRLKLSNTAGGVSLNTGANYIAVFKLKSKTKTTFREIFGDCPWADPFNFSGYVQALNIKDLNTGTTIQITTPETGTVSSQGIIYMAGQDEILDAITGDTVPSGTIVFLSVDTFAHDLGNVEIPSPIYTVQSSSANTDVTFVNGNRAIGVVAA